MQTKQAFLEGESPTLRVCLQIPRLMLYEFKQINLVLLPRKSIIEGIEGGIEMNRFPYICLILEAKVGGDR